MGLFDIFKKKDAKFYLERARRELDREQYAYARDDAKQGLEFDDLSADLEASLREAFTEAIRGICKLNLEEARTSLESGELNRARECIETARSHAPDDQAKEEVEAVARDLRAARDRAEAEAEAAEEAAAREVLDDQFQVYLSALAPDVVEVYNRFEETFAQAYVHLNSGEPREALELFEKVKPVNEEAAGLLAFEKARALLAVGDYERCLYWLDVTGSIRGAAPIFLSDHPSVAYLRYEALMYLNRQDEAAEALRVGLESAPDNETLRTALASILIHLKRFDEAEPLVDEGLANTPRDPQNHLLKARLLAAKGNRLEAIAVLENGIKITGPNPAALPNPLLTRALVELYLDEETNPQRVDTLLGQLLRAVQADADWYDYFLVARYHKWQQNDDEARSYAAQAMEFLPDEKDPRRKQVEALLE